MQRVDMVEQLVELGLHLAELRHANVEFHLRGLLDRGFDQFGRESGLATGDADHVLVE